MSTNWSPGRNRCWPPPRSKNLAEMRAALFKLPDEYREPLVLQVLMGFSTAEIARELDLSGAAVLTRLFRARKQLRVAVRRRYEHGSAKNDGLRPIQTVDVGRSARSGSAIARAPRELPRLHSLHASGCCASSRASSAPCAWPVSEAASASDNVVPLRGRSPRRRCARRPIARGWLAMAASVLVAARGGRRSMAERSREPASLPTS